MSERTLIITNLKYKSVRRRGRGSGSKGLRSTLKYLQYRDDRQQHVPQPGRERWVDHGLGRHYREIFQHCHALRSNNVLAWTWVVSPEPDLMTRIPEGERGDFIRDLTEAIVERYYEERGFSTPYSYVVHEALTDDGRPHTHTHVILPGLADHHLDGPAVFLNYKNKGHLELLDAISNDELAQALDRTLGHEWRREFGLDAPSPADDIPLDANDLAAWFPRW